MRTKIALLSLFMTVVTLSVSTSNSFAANPVKTKRVFVPEEKTEKRDQADENLVEGDDETVEPANPSIIPDSALPDLSVTPANPDDGVDDAPSAETTRNAVSPPDIMRDLSKLPPPVKRMHDLILTAARSGKIDDLRNLIGIGDTATGLSVGELEGDPIDFLKDASGDSEGYEILAILLEVLQAGFVHVDAGTPEELYVWPYFFAWPLDKLSPPQQVELYQLLTAGDVEDSQNFGSYIFYRVGITPEGEWAFFVAGD